MPFQVKKDPTRIAIIGTGDSWNLFPIQSDHTIYCLNDFVYFEKYQIMPDVLFILDILNEKPLIVAGISNLGDVISRINKMGVPLVAPYKYAEIPKSEAFPIKECVKEFGIPYFNNTISYMIAYALLKGAKEIDIYGVNQASSSEFFYEKASVEYWIGIAVGRGVKIIINGERSELISNKKRFGGNILYGYNQTFEEIMRAEKQFGDATIIDLSAPPKLVSRTVRQINK